MVRGSPKQPEPEFAVKDRVYYKDNGPTDTGTVTEVTPIRKRSRRNYEYKRIDHYEYAVKWDDGSTADDFVAGQLVRVEDVA